MKQKKSKTSIQQAPELNVWTISNGLSIFRLLLALPVVLLLLQPNANRLLILFLGILAYATDLADGFLARKLKQESEFGRMIDPLADKVFVAGVIIALMSAGYIPFWFVAVVLFRDAVILSGSIYLKALHQPVPPSNMPGKVAVVSVGLVMIFSLFEDTVSRSFISLLQLASVSLLAVSLYMYGERFYKNLTKKT